MNDRDMYVEIYCILFRDYKYFDMVDIVSWFVVMNLNFCKLGRNLLLWLYFWKVFIMMM